MTWFKHKCWFCGHISKDVVFIAGDSNYQCIDRVVCEQRHKDEHFTPEKSDVTERDQAQQPPDAVGMAPRSRSETSDTSIRPASITDTERDK